MNNDWTYWIITFLTPAIMLAPFIWPYVYIKLKKGNNTLLFVSISIGFMVIIGAMLEVLVYPIELYMRHFYPQLQANGIKTVDWLANISSIIGNYYWAIVLPPIYFLVPIFVYRRYENIV